MDHMVSSSNFFYITLIILAICKGISAAKFNIINKCEYTIWPGILSNAGSAPLDTTGFELPKGASRSFQSPPSWSGRFWARTGCNFDPATGRGVCATGDCGSNQIQCNGAGANPPATLAEFTVGANSGSGAQDFYDVSLVDGYNLPLIVEPSSGSGTCLTTGCVADLNRQCPTELRSGSGDGCKSACEAFGSPEYCCSGAYASPGTCKPSAYSQMFKAACPRSYSYAYDDATSTFTCSGADYTITFCPSLSASQKSASSYSSSTTGTTYGSGSGSNNETPTDDFSSWLPNFVNGHSPKTKTLPLATSLYIVFLISLFLLSH